MAVYKCAGRKRRDEENVPYCDYEAEARWLGRCPACGRLYDCDRVGPERASGRATLATLQTIEEKPRLSTGITGLDRVLGGGGLVPGTTVVLSGEPGCGKTTLLLQMADHLATERHPVLFASGEQTKEAISSIARRLGITNPHVIVLGMEGDIDKIMEVAAEVKARVVIVDSLQTARIEDVKANAGSSEQCRAVANVVTEWAPIKGVTVVLICHVDKAGDLAGPKAVEHLADTIVELNDAKEYDEDGELKPRTKDWVELLVGKNRHGESGLSALFNRGQDGMQEVERRSKLLRFPT